MRITQICGPLQGIILNEGVANSRWINFPSSNLEDWYVVKIGVQAPQAPHISQIEDSDWNKMSRIKMWTQNNTEFVINANDILEFDDIKEATINLNNIRIDAYNLDRYAIIDMLIRSKTE